VLPAHPLGDPDQHLGLLIVRPSLVCQLYDEHRAGTQQTISGKESEEGRERERREEGIMKYFFSRRKFLIQPRFQLALAAKAILFLVLYSAALALLILYPNGLTPEVKRQILPLPAYIWPLMLALGLIVVVHVILLSHRVAGPSFRLVRSIRQMTAGHYHQAMTLRKHDSLKEVAESLALLGDTLHRRRQTLLEELDKLRTRLEPYTDDLQSGKAPPALQHDLEWMAEQIRVLKRLAEGADVPGVTEPAVSDAGVPQTVSALARSNATRS
jgi:methyl-accepting chemotaxis protein